MSDTTNFQGRLREVGKDSISVKLFFYRVNRKSFYEKVTFKQRLKGNGVRLGAFL